MTTPTTAPRRRLGAIAALALPALLIALAGCAPTPGDANSPGASGGGDIASTELTFADWQLEYAACMRGEGIDMPDPEGDSQAIAIDLNGDMGAFEAANEHCMDELGSPPPLTAEEEAAAQERFLVWAMKAAECYRENGFDVPDPTADEPMQFPTDAPDEVVEECGGGATGAATPVG
jgi:hypothetical protein